MQLVNPLDVKNWNDLILDHSVNSLFLSSNWARVLMETYNYLPTYLVSFDSGKGINTAIPFMEISSLLTGKRGVSLPFTDYCEPICNCNFNEVLKEIVNFAWDSKWKSLEFRGGNRFFKEINPSSFYYHHTLDLSKGEKKIFSNFHPANKRNIRKALKEGIRVEFSISSDSIDSFYKLNCITRKRHGLPPQPYKFFKKIHKYILSENLGFIVLARYNNREIAGGVFFHFGKKALYKFGASEKEFQYLRPNNFIMWEAIKYFIEKEFKQLSFGKTEPENHGLRRFKLAWGTEEEKIFTYKYNIIKDKFVPNPDSAIGFHNIIFRMMPMPFLKFVGNTLYRHLG